MLVIVFHLCIVEDIAMYIFHVVFIILFTCNDVFRIHCPNHKMENPMVSPRQLLVQKQTAYYSPQLVTVLFKL